MFKTLLNVFRIAELRNKVLFTLMLLCVYRVGFYVPLPGVNAERLLKSAQSGQQSGSPLETISSYLTMFSGGDLGQSTIFGLGIMPYISASIILQLLATVIPTLEKLRKEGEPGIRKINEWTRYLTVGVCLVQSAMWVSYLVNHDGGRLLWPSAFYNTPLFVIQGVVVLTAGSLFLMWLGEQIDQYGIGNGVSLIITAGIVARMPDAILEVWLKSPFADFGATWRQAGFLRAMQKAFDLQSGATYSVPVIAFLIAAFVFVVAGSILLTQAQRRIKIQQAKHMRGRRVYGGAAQYLPLRVNHAGVMPIIFASSLMMFPSMLADWINSHQTINQMPWLSAIIGSFRPNYGGGGTMPYLYECTYVAMIFFFSYFWNTVQFQPKEMANQLRDFGSFIPGLRPGKRTADYLDNVMARITYVGAAFLCVIAVVPSLMSSTMGISWRVSQFLGGTGLLIVIQVMLDLVNRIEANLVMRNYGGFLEGGAQTARLRDRGPRPSRGGVNPSTPPQGLPT